MSIGAPNSFFEVHCSSSNFASPDDLFRDDCDIRSSVDLELDIDKEQVIFLLRVFFVSTDGFANGNYRDVIFT